MAYAPYNSTATANPPVLVSQPLAFGSTGSTLSASGAGGGKFWVYNSTHLQTDVGSSDFVSDGQALGFEVGDALMAIGASGISFHRCSALGSTYTSFTTGLLVSSGS